LDKIKAERALAQAKKEEEERYLEEALNKESALRGNPLLNLSSGSSNEKVSCDRPSNTSNLFALGQEKME
jgi:hypothetical protein